MQEPFKLHKFSSSQYSQVTYNVVNDKSQNVQFSKQTQLSSSSLTDPCGP